MGKIIFKKTAPRNLATIGDISSLVIQALKEIGKDNVTDKEIAVHIKDTGIGIPEDSLEHIFDRFFRVEKKVHTIKGTGLGLTIVTKILEKHEGRITVDSSLGEGSTFSFFIPFYIDPALKLARVGSDSENGSGANSLGSDANKTANKAEKKLDSHTAGTQVNVTDGQAASSEVIG